MALSVYKAMDVSDLKEMLHSVAIVDFFIFLYFLLLLIVMLVRKVKGNDCK